MNILMVLTSHASLGDTGRPTGFWLEEFVTPYYVFRDEGAQVTLASPRGGPPPIDPSSELSAQHGRSVRRFEADPLAHDALARTRMLRDVAGQPFDGVFYVGGHGVLWDLVEDRDSIALVERMLASGRPLAAVCHAPAVLRDAKTPEGAPVLRGRRVTGFSNSEEHAAGLANVVPFLLQDMLVQQGARYSQGGDGQAHVVRDGMLVTGQNAASSGPAADAMCRCLRLRRAAQPPAPDTAAAAVADVRA